MQREPSPGQRGQVIAADDEAFKALVASSQRPLLVLFWAPWSGPDRVVLSYLDAVARERPALQVVKVDVDRAPEAARRYRILSVPTAMVLLDGRRRGRRVIGALPRKRWERELDLNAVAPHR